METSPFHFRSYMMCILEDIDPGADLLLPLSFVGLEICQEGEAHANFSPETIDPSSKEVFFKGS